MTRTNKLSLIILSAATLAAPAIAAADHPVNRWTRLGEVGTHSHDAEDFVTVSTNERYESIELRGEGRPVRLDGVKVHFTDGRSYFADVNWTLQPGERIMIDVPAYSPIKMLTLDYDNKGPHWRAREDARVEVRGMSVERDDRYRDDDRRDDRRYEQRDRRYPAPRYEQRDRRDRSDTRFEWRAGIYVRIR